MTEPAYFQTSGTLLGTLLIALTVTGGFLPNSRNRRAAASDQPHASRARRAAALATARGLGALAGTASAIVGEARVFLALLHGSPVSRVSGVSWWVGATVAALINCVLVDVVELGQSWTRLGRRGTAVAVAAAVVLSLLAGSAWVILVRRSD